MTLSYFWGTQETQSIETISRCQDVNYKAQNGWTPLTLAVFHGKLDSVEALCKILAGT